MLLLLISTAVVCQDQLEHTRRDNSGLHEGERQLQLKIKTLQNCLKSEKEEVREAQVTCSDPIMLPYNVLLIQPKLQFCFSNTKFEMHKSNAFSTIRGHCLRVT